MNFEFTKKWSLEKIRKVVLISYHLCPRILRKEKNVSIMTEPVVTIASKSVQLRNDTQLRVPIKLGDGRGGAQVTENMQKFVSLFNTDGMLNTFASNYLKETNSDFFVIGVIGMQGAGKSSILNLLATSISNRLVEYTSFDVNEKIFPVNNAFSARECPGFENEIRMHITRDRVILLDSAPVLTNNIKTDFVVSELKDIQRINLLLNICHILIVLQDEYYNTNFARLIMHAKMIQQGSQNHLTPRLLFLTNKCNRNSQNLGCQSSHDLICTVYGQEKAFKDIKNQINVMRFPYVTARDPGLLSSVLELRKLVFSKMMPACFQNQDGLTEKSWFHTIANITEKHRSNYFIRKYENLKEKYNLHNHVNVVENAAKDKRRRLSDT
ncbi:nonsense-mediated mRNA decay factor SMG9 isoform X2 [Sabethes cyaneus]|uniref:nonsense-mediated mRNA decay factor SMG9 isoform X2 n=1 Tax=Sabethes cyaneus TaxID=53552 RepID=UPI00237DDDAB|nr:nonsense-mediated mRNA decay factor SMG9 isoform X2 [Sabethes cyaneus]